MRGSLGSVCSAWRVINYSSRHFRANLAEWRSAPCLCSSTCEKNHCRGHPERTHTQTKPLSVIACRFMFNQLGLQKDLVRVKMQLRFGLSNSQLHCLIFHMSKILIYFYTISMNPYNYASTQQGDAHKNICKKIIC